MKCPCFVARRRMASPVRNLGRTSNRMERRMRVIAYECRVLAELHPCDRRIIATVLAADPKLDIATAIRACRAAGM